MSASSFEIGGCVLALFGEVTGSRGLGVGGVLEGLSGPQMMKMQNKDGRGKLIRY